ncbi:MAG: ribosome maturation factor RimP [Limnobacter sp.]|nr:ribosome maturation factor RimP [Limnobacter sp.]
MGSKSENIRWYLVNPEEFAGNGWAGVWAERWVPDAEAAIASLGLELADLEREQGGLLRVSIDSPKGVTVVDCEKVSHQLSNLLTVENVPYERLEVSSPGVDRPLRRLRDFNRFVGHEVSLKLKKAVENQKNFKGILRLGEISGFVLEYMSDSGQKPVQLNFEIADVAAARLVPHLQF